MKRKIIKQGIGGNTIFLPIKWVREHNLQPGDEIDILEAEQGLLISSEAKLKKKEIDLKFDEEKEPIQHIYLNILYRQGYDKINIRLKNKKQTKFIQKIVDKSMLGFEVIEKEENKICIDNVTEPSSEKQQTLLRRIFLINLRSFEIIIKDMEKGDFKNLKKLQELTFKSNKYEKFCRRNISRKKFTEKNIYSHWELYKSISYTQLFLMHMYEVLSEQKKMKIPKELIALFKEIFNTFEKTYEGFYQKDIKKVSKNSEVAREKFYKVILKELEKRTGPINAILYYYGEISRQTYLLTVPMLGLLLEENPEEKE
jgi:hypothetical protein